MIDPEKLRDAFINHARKCRSGPVVCSLHVAFESWFRVEIAPALIDLGFENISFEYTYPGTKKKADLLVQMSDGATVIEIKSFVQGADAKKLSDFPNQVARLESSVTQGDVAQGMAFCTFVGYGQRRLSALIEQFFGQSWQTTIPCPIIDEAPLKFLLASFRS